MTQLLFQIQLFHPFFTDGVFEDCQLLADPATAHAIEHYQLLTRRAAGTFGLYTSSQRSAAQLMQYLAHVTGDAPLRFFLTCNNRHFVFITDLPLGWVGQVTLNSGAGAMQADNGQATISLTPTMLSGGAGAEGVIGEVSIYPSDLVALLAAGFTAIAYTAHFQVRSLHWIYTVINRSQTCLYQPAVRGRDGINFTGPFAKTLADGEAALEFCSGAMQFALQQVPTVLVDLVDTVPPPLHADAEPVDSVVLRGLPTPQAGQFGARQTASTSYCFAQMYVYL